MNTNQPRQFLTTASANLRYLTSFTNLASFSASRLATGFTGPANITMPYDIHKSSLTLEEWEGEVIKYLLNKRQITQFEPPQQVGHTPHSKRAPPPASISSFKYSSCFDHFQQSSRLIFQNCPTVTSITLGVVAFGFQVTVVQLQEMIFRQEPTRLKESRSQWLFEPFGLDNACSFQVLEVLERKSLLEFRVC